MTNRKALIEACEEAALQNEKGFTYKDDIEFKTVKNPHEVSRVLGVPRTIGELKEFIKDFKDSDYFEFRNQFRQTLHHSKFHNTIDIVFFQPEESTGKDFRDIAKTILQSLANTGAEFENEKLAVDLIEETLKKEAYAGA